MADDKKTKALIRAQLDATDANVQAFATTLDSFLYKQLSKLLDPLNRSKIDKREVSRVLNSLNRSLDEAGLQQVMQRLNQAYGKQLEYVLSTFDDAGSKAPRFSDVDTIVIEELISYDVEKVTTRVQEYVTDIKRTFQTGVLSGDVRPFAELHDKFAPGLEGQVKTELNTALQGFYRTVTAAKSKELGFELFRYIGPDDDITRPFCESLLERDPAIYTIDEIEAMDNDQGLSVLTFGGGYNCRHQWRPVTEESARALGYV
jgi:hypothetical protein